MMTALRPEVQAFAEVMESTLRRHDHKGGWQDCKLAWLLGRLIDEVGELELALNGNAVGGDVLEEAADVANFAMMIADNRGVLKVTLR